VVLISDKEAGR